MLRVDGEILVERTIRLLKENGIKDIAISTDIKDYDYLGVEILKNDKGYIHDTHGNMKKSSNCWLTAYYPLETPASYLAGDVYWTEQAIKDIINTKVKSTMFICAPDISDGRKNPSIKGREPLGYIVQNQKIFRKAINDILKEIDDEKFTYDPIAWNLYRKLNGIPMDYHGYGNDIFKTHGDFLAIDDLTTDIDLQKNIPALENLIKFMKGGLEMIKVEVTKRFHLGAYNKIKNIVRVGNDIPHELFVGDVFECDTDMAKYLLNETPNPANESFVKVIEVIPKKTQIKKLEETDKKEKAHKKTTIKKSTKKEVEKK